MNLHTRQNRRQFIKRTIVTTGALGLTTAFRRLQIHDRSQVDSAALAKFRARLKGRLVLPTDPGYEAARRIYFWNPDTERRPALVARCAHGDDVRLAVEFARTHELEVAVRGGGHSPMGWGTSDGLIIDLSGINSIAIDPARRTARIDAGASSVSRHASGGTPWACPGARAVPWCRGCRSDAGRRPGLALRTSWRVLRQPAVGSCRHRGRPCTVGRCDEQPGLVVGPPGAPEPTMALSRALTAVFTPLVPSRTEIFPIRFARRDRSCDSSATSWPKRRIRFKPRST
jgi:hypothetical protein